MVAGGQAARPLLKYYHLLIWLMFRCETSLGQMPKMQGRRRFRSKALAILRRNDDIPLELILLWTQLCLLYGCWRRTTHLGKQTSNCWLPVNVGTLVRQKHPKCGRRKELIVSNTCGFAADARCRQMRTIDSHIARNGLKYVNVMQHRAAILVFDDSSNAPCEHECWINSN